MRTAGIAVLLAGLPLLLVQWARATSGSVEMPPYGSRAGGVVLCAGGLLLMAMGARALRRRAGGAFSTNTLVTTGVYRWLPHPMYLGAALAVFGTAVACESPSGLWLVAPVFMLACAALVFGYERPALERQFPHAAREYLWLPAAHDGPPAGMARIRCYLFLLAPWVVIYEILVWSGTPKDAFTLALPGEPGLPIFSWAEPVYMSTYVMVGLAPLLARTSRSLREFMLRGWLAMAISFSLYLAFPVIAPHKPFLADGFWGKALEYERGADPPLNAFPSFHTIWAFLTAALLAVRNPKRAWMGWLWAAGVGASCVATGMHWTADVLAGFVLSLALIHSGRVRAAVLRRTERLANSWREWRLGPVQVAVHGLYGGAAAFAGFLIAGWLAGPANEWAVLAAGASALVGAALWSQWSEDCSGYFGGMASGAVAATAAPLFGGSTMTVIAAWCAAAPAMLAVTRLRCLMQGCCHGRVASEQVGIRYRHPRALAELDPELREQPLYPVPLYSMVWSVFAAMVLARMWWAGCELHMIAGVFGIVMGAGRFVEEGFQAERGPAILGLPTGQWLAAATAVAGGIFTSLPLTATAGKPEFEAGTLYAAAAIGCLVAPVLAVERRARAEATAL
jgi:protein-S-isoprenylcysteine O-methyltransferase Ste14/membrane-associated phospholipid phosphatase